GRLGEARQLYERTEAMARRASLGQVAAGYELQLAWAELLFGRTSDAAARAGPLVASGSADVTPLAVAILALAGQPDGLDAALDRVAHMRPDDMLLRTVFLPVARASQQLARGRAQEAIKTLDVSEPYDLGRVAAFVPAYLRAEAYARLGNGPAAVAQYQRILDHRGTDPFSVFYAAARVGLARAHVLAGNREAARQSYDEFLAAWSRADAQLPLLLAARAERMAVADTSHATR
ncbi:MAG: prkC 12, partial [Acidobacteria bacterium]|nr:prkC 12 [Acidobacteriota bacterium]